MAAAESSAVDRWREVVAVLEGEWGGGGSVSVESGLEYRRREYGTLRDVERKLLSDSVVSIPFLSSVPENLIGGGVHPLPCMIEGGGFNGYYADFLCGLFLNQIIPEYVPRNVVFNVLCLGRKYFVSDWMPELDDSTLMGGENLGSITEVCDKYCREL
jgi:hypothetical protein